MKKTWNKRTNLVHSGNRRSQYNEVSESIFLTQSYVYETAEDAEKRFSEDIPKDRFIYTRYGNPTIAMFEDKIATLEGAEAAFATASSESISIGPFPERHFFTEIAPSEISSRLWRHPIQMRRRLLHSADI